MNGTDQTIVSFFRETIQFYCPQRPSIFDIYRKCVFSSFIIFLIKISHGVTSLKVVAFPSYLICNKISSCPTLFIAHHFFGSLFDIFLLFLFSVCYNALVRRSSYRYSIYNAKNLLSRFDNLVLH